MHGLPCSYPDAGQATKQAQAPSAAATPVSRSASQPLTPPSDLSQPNWNPELHVVDPAVLLLPSQGWDLHGDSDWEFAVLNGGSSAGCTSAVGHESEASIVGLFPVQQPSSDPFCDLSVYLSGRWTGAEQGLDFLDGTLKGYIDGFATGLHRPAFVHSRHWDASTRPLALLEATAVGQLYATVRMSPSDTILLRSIDNQLVQVQRSVRLNTQSL